MLSVPERLSSFQEIKRFVHLPKYFIKVLASCTTSVYVNLSKNSFFTPDFSKAGAKVRLFSEPPKLFQENFHLLCKKLSALDQYQAQKTDIPY